MGKNYSHRTTLGDIFKNIEKVSITDQYKLKLKLPLQNYYKNCLLKNFVREDIKDITEINDLQNEVVEDSEEREEDLTTLEEDVHNDYEKYSYNSAAIFHVFNMRAQIFFEKNELHSEYDKLDKRMIHFQNQYQLESEKQSNQSLPGKVSLPVEQNRKKKSPKKKSQISKKTYIENITQQIQTLNISLDNEEGFFQIIQNKSTPYDVLKSLHSKLKKIEATGNIEDEVTFFKKNEYGRIKIEGAKNSRRLIISKKGRNIVDFVKRDDPIYINKYVKPSK